jgi:hypothetical protein
MDRKEELLQEIRLRRLIRKAIELKEAKQRKQEKQHKFEENKLRYLIRHLILEGEVDADAEPAGYSSTPVNVLADALNEILKTLKHGLRKMKQPEERRSYRAHVLEKFKSIFSNFEGLDIEEANPIGESDVGEAEPGENKLQIKLDDPDRVMPSDGKEDDRFKEPEKDPEKELENEFETFRMAGENPTGARFAFETINNSNIEQVLADKRKLLFTPEYRQEFKEYALYNIDLWLLTYEKEFADSEGQEPAFTETVMPKPSGAETAGSATEFEGGGFEDELEEILMMENEYVGE